jgi:hypothetical protein
MTEVSPAAQAQAVRLQAKKKRSTPGVAPHELDEIIERLVQSIAALTTAIAGYEPGSELYRDTAGEISDCLGVKGGTLRDLQRFEAAARAYDEGAVWEAQIVKSGGRATSYCLLQRLVNRILLTPQAFAPQSGHEEPVLGVILSVALKEARETILQQINNGGRRKDPWARADVALVDELLGQVDDAEDSWLELENLKPLANVYGSTADALRPLFKALADHVPADRAAAHQELLKWLEEKAATES